MPPLPYFNIIEMCLLSHYGSNFVLFYSNNNHTGNILEIKTEINPISALQEISIALGWKLPQYELVEVDISLFKIECILMSYKTMGYKFV